MNLDGWGSWIRQNPLLEDPPDVSFPREVLSTSHSIAFDFVAESIDAVGGADPASLSSERGGRSTETPDRNKSDRSTPTESVLRKSCAAESPVWNSFETLSIRDKPSGAGRPGTLGPPVSASATAPSLASFSLSSVLVLVSTVIISSWLSLSVKVTKLPDVGDRTKATTATTTKDRAFHQDEPKQATIRESRLMRINSFTMRVFSHHTNSGSRRRVIKKRDARANGDSDDVTQELTQDFAHDETTVESSRNGQLKQKQPQQEQQEQQDQFDLEREQTRLESFEAYILVSILTASASFAVLCELQPEEYNSHFSIDSVAFWAYCATVFMSGVSSIAGLHATVVFSLCLLYGKTALGMQNDEAYSKFVTITSAQRVRAFNSFSASLLFFALVMSMILIEKAPTILRLPAIAFAIYGTFYVFSDWHGILEAAKVIFAKPKSS
eukprot:CAMPEP_0168842330 /NCGR_PEP_ID=MMETSP0727-20121128/7638_1 /TAXON_ID=265536 /ORGANISM="Amphiprora sp., Strain CCMP467" /LENGTH=438 /DNA_ID=CAMNT_0008895883 /DNA_START=408 /DNA_END=1725 /DNA_ORIENTATION=+